MTLEDQSFFSHELNKYSRDPKSSYDTLHVQFDPMLFFLKNKLEKYHLENEKVAFFSKIK